MEPTTLLSCAIDIQGMKCQSCVRNIEKTIGAKLGVASIKVDLEKKEATVQYDADLIQPAQVADFIQAMGFASQVKSTVVFPGKPSTSLYLAYTYLICLIEITCRCSRNLCH